MVVKSGNLLNFTGKTCKQIFFIVIIFWGMDWGRGVTVGAVAQDVDRGNTVRVRVGQTNQSKAPMWCANQLQVIDDAKRKLDRPNQRSETHKSTNVPTIATRQRYTQATQEWD